MSEEIKAAPPNSLPTWDECALRVDNSDYLAERKAGGGYGPEDSDSPQATELHRFIHEYDDSDPYRSAWFMYRLELVLNEARTAAPTIPAGYVLVPVEPTPEMLAAVRGHAGTNHADHYRAMLAARSKA